MRKMLMVLSIVCSVVGCASPGMTGTAQPGFDVYHQGP